MSNLKLTVLTAGVVTSVSIWTVGVTPEPTRADVSTSPTEVVAETTETTQVMDNHNGTFTLSASLEPVRAITGDGWKPLDLTLRTDPTTGRIAPTNAANPVSFSPGGDDQATATFHDGDKSISVTLPTELPEPTLSGPTATYAQIYPGVDLQLTATPTGYSDVLIVHNAQAATKPEVKNPRWELSTDGYALHASDDGSLSTTADDGDTITTSTPTMWDSSTVVTGPTPSAQIPSADLSVLPATLANATTKTTDGQVEQTATVSLTPTSSDLSGPGVTYPLFIDPSVAINKHHTLTVSSGGVQAYDSSTRYLQVGYCGWDGCGSIGTARSFLDFDISAITNRATTATVFDAKLQVQQLWSASSAATPVNLWHTAGFGPSTAWPGPSTATYIGQISSNVGFEGKSKGYLTFDNDTLKSVMQTAATRDWASATFGLYPADGDNPYQWKQFATSTKNDEVGPKLTITYGFPASTPRDLGIGNPLACPGKPVYTQASIGTDNRKTPILKATATRYDPSDASFGISFRLYRHNSTDPDPVFSKSTKTTVFGSSGTPVQWNSFAGTNTTSTGPLYDGTWEFDARGDSNSAQGLTYSAWSSRYKFIVDTTAPPGATFGSANGNTTVTATGATGFVWSTTTMLPTLGTTECTYNKTSTTDSFGNPTSGIITATSGTATIPSGAGPNPIYVRPFDDAHNVGPCTWSSRTDDSVTENCTDQ